MKRGLLVAFLGLASHTWARLPEGATAHLKADSLVRARVDSAVGRRAGFMSLRIDGDVEARIVSHEEKLGIDHYLVTIVVSDAERVCSESRPYQQLLAEVREEMLESNSPVTHSERQLDQLIEDLKRSAPHLDWSAVTSLQKPRVPEILHSLRRGRESLQELLLVSCGDPNRVDPEKLSKPQEFAGDLEARKAEDLSTDYAALLELREQLTKIPALDTTAYQKILRLPKSEEYQHIRKARQLIRNIVDTSLVESPNDLLRADLRRAFALPLLQQLILEEVAARFSAAQESKGEERQCFLLVTSLRLFQHVDADVGPFGIEEANSLLLLYRIFHGAYFSSHHCAKIIESKFGPLGRALPYHLQFLRNPAIGQQRSVTHYFLFIPYKTERLNEDEWVADVANFGPVVMDSPQEDRGQRSKYYWKNGAVEGQAANSGVLISLWSKRAKAL